MNRDDLLRAALAAFSLTPQETATIATLIADNAAVGYRSAYHDALRAAGVRNSAPLIVTPLVLMQLQLRSQQMAQTIAATYQRELASAISGFLATLDDNAPEQAAQRDLWYWLQRWASERADYKAGQIANAEVGYAADLATRSAAQAIQSGQYGPPPPRLRARVVPSESSSDFCQQYAGQTFTLDELNDIPAFPAHPNCIHEIELERY